MKIFETGYSENFDGPGTRLIYYLKGCNFHCDWCGAPESISPETEILHYPERTVIAGKEISPEEILKKALAAQDFISGVTFGGGEPTLQAAELLRTLKLLKEHNIHTALESNGSTPAYPEAAKLVDWLFTDLKTLNKELFARRISSNLELLDIFRKNLRFAAENQPHLVIRIPVVTGLNDTPEEQQKLIDFCCELKAVRPDGILTVQLLRQHHLAEPKYLALGRVSPCKEIEPPAKETVAAFAKKLCDNHINATFFG